MTLFGEYAFPNLQNIVYEGKTAEVDCTVIHCYWGRTIYVVLELQTQVITLLVECKIVFRVCILYLGTILLISIPLPHLEDSDEMKKSQYIIFL